MKSWGKKAAALLPALLVGCLVVGLALFLNSLRRRSGPRNLVVILIDCLRADHLRSYGYKRETAPFLDTLAHSGVLFRDVTSQASQTKLSVASLFTSMRPSTHKVRKVDHFVTETEDNVLSSVLSGDFVTLAEAFSEAGFATGGWVANPHLRSFLGFSQGFEEYYYTELTNGRELSSRFLSWLDKAEPARFFAYLHFMDVHHPYSPPPPFNTAFTKRKARVWYRNGYMMYVPPENLSYAVSQYDGEILYLDSVLREMFAELDRRGLTQQTLFVVTADHGDEFFEHHGMGHGFTVYQELLEVPLIMYWPEKLAPREVDAPVRLIDIYPTLLELFAITPPYQLQGRSLVALLQGGSLPETPIYSESSNDLRSLRRGSQKLIEGFGGNREAGRAYELDSDPLEYRPLVENAGLEKLRKEIAKLAAMDEVRARDFGVGEKTKLDRRTLEALRNLGYAD